MKDDDDEDEDAEPKDNEEEDKEESDAEESESEESESGESEGSDNESEDSEPEVVILFTFCMSIYLFILVLTNIHRILPMRKRNHTMNHESSGTKVDWRHLKKEIYCDRLIWIASLMKLIDCVMNQLHYNTIWTLSYPSWARLNTDEIFLAEKHLYIRI